MMPWLHDSRCVCCLAMIYCVVLDKLLSLSGPLRRDQTRSDILNLRCSDEHQEGSMSPQVLCVCVNMHLFRVEVLKGVLSATPG